MLELHLHQGPYKVFRLRLLLLAAAVVSYLWSTHAHAAETLHFPHEDQRYLREGQHHGGAAFVPDAVLPENRVPAVVFLHGTNRSGALHLWLGGGGRDLRPLTERLVQTGKARPFILAAPSQTAEAAFGHSLWPSFDLARFVMDLGDALGERARLDPGSIYLFGHSGAGCNPEGGLAVTTDDTLLPAGLVAIDPCFDDEMGEAMAQRPPGLPFWVLWQSQVWRRDFAAWESALRLAPEGAKDCRITHLIAPGPHPHDSIVPVAFELAVRNLLAKKPTEAQAE